MLLSLLWTFEHTSLKKMSHFGQECNAFFSYIFGHNFFINGPILIKLSGKQAGVWIHIWPCLFDTKVQKQKTQMGGKQSGHFFLTAHIWIFPSSTITICVCLLHQRPNYLIMWLWLYMLFNFSVKLHLDIDWRMHLIGEQVWVLAWWARWLWVVSI